LWRFITGRKVSHMKPRRTSLTPIIIFSIGMGISGCIPLLPGVVSQEASPEFYRIGPNGIDSVGEGDRLVIVVDAGESVSGEFLGMVERSAEKYYDDYVCWRERLSAEFLLPAPGEMVRIQWELPGKRVIAKGVVAGADTAGVYVAMAKRNEAGAVRVAIADVVSIIDEHGRAMDVSFISDLVRRGQIGALTTLLNGRGELAFSGLNVVRGQGKFSGIDHSNLFFRDSTGAERRVETASVHQLSGPGDVPLSGVVLNNLLRQESPPGFKSIVVKRTMDTVLVATKRIRSIVFYPSSDTKTDKAILLVLGGVAAGLLLFYVFVKAITSNPI
jgi:hypothetical protein